MKTLRVIAVAHEEVTQVSTSLQSYFQLSSFLLYLRERFEAQITTRFPYPTKAMKVSKLSPFWAFQNLPITFKIFIDLF